VETKLETTWQGDGASLYLPKLVRILDMQTEVPAEAVTGPIVNFTIERNGIDFRPGQFFEISVFGAGEVPISISSPPSLKDRIILSVRAAGYVTSLLHQLKPGDYIGLRGPLGNGFPMEEFYGFDVLFVAGGIGLAPLRGLLWEMLFQRGEVWANSAPLRRTNSEGLDVSVATARVGEKGRRNSLER